MSYFIGYELYLLQSIDPVSLFLYGSIFLSIFMGLLNRQDVWVVFLVLVSLDAHLWSPDISILVRVMVSGDLMMVLSLHFRQNIKFIITRLQDGMWICKPGTDQNRFGCKTMNKTSKEEWIAADGSILSAPLRLGSKKRTSQPYLMHKGCLTSTGFCSWSLAPRGLCAFYNPCTVKDTLQKKIIHYVHKVFPPLTLITLNPLSSLRKTRLEEWCKKPSSDEGVCFNRHSCRDKIWSDRAAATGTAPLWQLISKVSNCLFRPLSVGIHKPAKAKERGPNVG